MSHPTEPGFYWAKWNDIKEPDWRVVDLVHLRHEGLVVFMPGNECEEPPESFEWGPKLEPPQ